LPYQGDDREEDKTGRDRTFIAEMRNAQKIFITALVGKTKHRWENNIKLHIKKGKVCRYDLTF
jgi:hypothetical protein